MGPIKKRTLLWILPLFLGLSATALAVAQLPNFRPGLWQFDRTIEDPAVGLPQKMQAQKCVDPKADIQKQHQMLQQHGCTVTPLTQVGQVYHFKASCNFPNGGHGTSVTDITYESDSAYSAKIESEGMSKGGKTHEELRAKRVGDCQ